METITSAILSELESYWPEASFARVREFRPSCGYVGDERRIDLWVIERSPSSGMRAHSVEVKASRSDFLRELKSPLKRRMAMAVSNFMWIAAPPGVVEPSELPLMVGLLEVRTDGDKWGRVKRVHPAEYRDKVRPTWGMVASLVRKIQEDK